MKKDYIIKEVPYPLMLDAANIAYPYESMDVFQDVSLYTVTIERQASIYNQCRHSALAFPLRLLLPLGVIAVS